MEFFDEKKLPVAKTVRKTAVKATEQSDKSAFNLPIFPHKITAMIINAEQKCTVNYSDRMCSTNEPE